MARKYELGLRYFSHDTDMAHDRNVRRLTKRYGAAGLGVFIGLLECIYHQGHFIEYSDELVFDILDSLNMDDGDEVYIKEVIKYSIEVDLFDAGLFESANILTSHGIQERYFMAKESSIARSKGKDNAPEYKYLLVDITKIGEKEQTPPNATKRHQTPPQPPEEEVLPFEEEPVPKVETKKKPLTEEEQRFDDWVKENYPNIHKMSRKLTLAEYNDLTSKFGKNVVDETMYKLDNYKPINKKYTYAKRTINDWCKRETENNNGKLRTEPATQPTLAEQLASLSRSRRQG